MSKMSPLEIRSSLSLGLIFFLRMFGLFLILPVFSLFALDIQHATPTLVGFALGIYGLTQAMFQIPFGMLSDRFGRKPMITIGLIVFFVGSVIAGSSENIYWLIIGRALQGAGAVASVIMALLADNVSTEHRTKAMAMIGMSVGLAFLLSFVVGPMLSEYLGLSGLFFMTAIIALIALVVLHFIVPNSQQTFHKETELDLSQLSIVIRDKGLLSLDLGIFILHLILTANFIVIPIILFENLGIHSAEHWQIYLPAMLLAITIMIPFVLIADKKQKGPIFYLMMIGVLLFSQFGFFLIGHDYWLVFLFLTLFFTAFNFLEASLPALISKTVAPERKGTALGIYSTSQFMGSFIGGILGGYAFSRFGISSVFMLSAGFISLWLLLTFFSLDLLDTNKKIVSNKAEILSGKG